MKKTKFKPVSLKPFPYGSFVLGILFVVALAFLSITSVGAAPEWLNTPMPTFTQITTPLPQTNLLSDVSFACPAGAPVGEGYVTPSVNWMAVCGVCLSDVNAKNPTTTPAYETATSVPVTTTPCPGGGCLGQGTKVAPGTATPIIINTLMAPPSGGGSGCNTEAPTINESDGSFAVTVAPHSCSDLGWPDMYESVTVSPYFNGIKVDFVFSKTSNVAEDNCIELQFAHSSGDGHIAYMRAVGNSDGGYWYEGPRILSAFGAAFATGSNPASGIGSFDITRSPSTNGAGVGALTFRVAVNKEQGADWRGSVYVMPQPVVIVDTSCEAPIGGEFGNYCEAIHTENDDLEDSFFDVDWGSVIGQKCFTFEGLNYASLLSWLAVTLPPPFGFLAQIVEALASFNFVTAFEVQPIMFCIRYTSFSLTLLGITIPVTQFISFGVLLGGFRFWLSAFGSFGSIAGGSMRGD